MGWSDWTSKVTSAWGSAEKSASKAWNQVSETVAHAADEASRAYHAVVDEPKKPAPFAKDGAAAPRPPAKLTGATPVVSTKGGGAGTAAACVAVGGIVALRAPILGTALGAGCLTLACGGRSKLEDPMPDGASPTPPTPDASASTNPEPSPDCEPVVDQKQESILKNAPPSWKELGYGVDQRFAQAVTVGKSGDLVAVELPVTCNGSSFTIEIQGVNTAGGPDGQNRLIADFGEANMPPPDSAGFRRFSFSDSASLPVTQGQQIAIVLSNPNLGDCLLEYGATGDTYKGGSAFCVNDYQGTDKNGKPVWGSVYDENGNVNWRTSEDDLAFRTVIRPCKKPDAGL